jgi:S-DNA-T family DNA segregation ATPase FtsK/SpoIIIE
VNDHDLPSLETEQHNGGQNVDVAQKEHIPLMIDASTADQVVQHHADSEKSFYTIPDVNIFATIPSKSEPTVSERESKECARILEEKLERFGIYGTIISIKHGPVVTLFEYQPAIDTKLSKILALEDDLALALQALSIRILAPIPGKSVVGFEVAHKNRKDVVFNSIMKSSTYISFDGALPLISWARYCWG